MKLLRPALALLALLALGLLGSVAYAAHPSADGQVATTAAPAKAPPARSLAAATGDDRRYALANGCYALRSQSAGGFVAKAAGGYRASAASVGEAEAFRMQATALGSYLFYGRDRDFMAAGALNVVSPAGDAGPAADWRVDANPGGTFTITLPSAGKALAVAADRLVLVEPAGAGAFSFEPAGGCAVYPEAETSASGRPFTSRTAWGQVKGIIDLHLHMMAFEFLGGPPTAAGLGIRTARPTRWSTAPTTGPQRLRRGAGERALRQPRPLPRPRRLADLQGLAAPRLADPRADLLQVARARLAWAGCACS